MTEQDFKDNVLPLSAQVFPMARRLLGNNEAARDAIQQSMLKLWENRKQLSTCTNVKAFTFKVVRNTCLDEIKRKKPVLFDMAEQGIHFDSQHEQNLDSKEAWYLVKTIIEQLPELQREVIQMRDVDDLDFEEIAGVMELEITHVRVLLSRARKTVREKLVKIYAYEAVKQN